MNDERSSVAAPAEPLKGEAVAEVHRTLNGNIMITWANNKSMYDFVGAKLYTSAPAEPVSSQRLPECERCIDSDIAYNRLVDHAVELETVLRGVIAEADRDTDPFIRARALLAAPPIYHNQQQR